VQADFDRRGGYQSCLSDRVGLEVGVASPVCELAAAVDLKGSFHSLEGDPGLKHPDFLGYAGPGVQLSQQGILLRKSLDEYSVSQL